MPINPAPARKKATKVLIAEDDDDDFYIFSVAIEETSFAVIISRLKTEKFCSSCIFPHALNLF